MKHTDTRQTLAAIDATLRLTDKPLWQDPEFLEWETGQTLPLDTIHVDVDGEICHLYYSRPGPEHASRYGKPSVHPRPMAVPAADYRRSPVRLCADDYPPPEDTVHGPLLLGPEPA